MIGGVNYFTGQAFDIEAISKAAHQVGAYAGYDLAHAIGNVNLQLHDWDVDFAVWCSYKYLNAGPGGVGGAFVHQQHHDVDLPRFGGWWGHREEERFLMKKGFQPAIGADGWQLSNAPILPLAAYMASLEIFNEVGFSNLLARSRVLTGYLEYLIKESKHTSKIQIITPTHPNERGAQLSLIFNDHAKHVFKHLHQNNFIVDWREPNVIRVSPVPLYNSFLDVYHFMTCINQLLG
jgi:kynureninase